MKKCHAHPFLLNKHLWLGGDTTGDRKTQRGLLWLCCSHTHTWPPMAWPCTYVVSRGFCHGHVHTWFPMAMHIHGLRWLCHGHAHTWSPVACCGHAHLLPDWTSHVLSISRDAWTAGSRPVQLFVSSCTLQEWVGLCSTFLYMPLLPPASMPHPHRYLISRPRFQSLSRNPLPYSQLATWEFSHQTILLFSLSLPPSSIRHFTGPWAPRFSDRGSSASDFVRGDSLDTSKCCRWFSIWWFDGQ